MPEFFGLWNLCVYFGQCPMPSSLKFGCRLWCQLRVCNCVFEFLQWRCKGTDFNKICFHVLLFICGRQWHFCSFIIFQNMLWSLTADIGLVVVCEYHDWSDRKECVTKFDRLFLLQQNTMQDVWHMSLNTNRCVWLTDRSAYCFYFNPTWA